MTAAPESQASTWAREARHWWRRLQPLTADGEPNPRTDRAALAGLRRTAILADALVEPAVLDLYQRLGFGREEVSYRLPWVAATALVLAHVRKEASSREGQRVPSPAAQVGRPHLGADFTEAPVKPLRFRRLLQARQPEELVRELRRLVQLADREVDVGQLATAILSWPHPEWGERVRTRWAYDYHGAGHAAPDGQAA